MLSGGKSESQKYQMISNYYRIQSIQKICSTTTSRLARLTNYRVNRAHLKFEKFPTISNCMFNCFDHKMLQSIAHASSLSVIEVSLCCVCIRRASGIQTQTKCAHENWYWTFITAIVVQFINIHCIHFVCLPVNKQVCAFALCVRVSLSLARIVRIVCRWQLTVWVKVCIFRLSIFIEVLLFGSARVCPSIWSTSTD